MRNLRETSASSSAKSTSANIFRPTRTRRLAAGVENNASFQAKSLTEQSEIIRMHVEQKKVQVVAGVYDLATGKVRWLEVK